MAGQGAKGGGQVAMPAAQAMGGSRGPMGPQGTLGGPSYQMPSAGMRGSSTSNVPAIPTADPYRRMPLQGAGSPSAMGPQAALGGPPLGGQPPSAEMIANMGGNVSVATGPIDTGLGAEASLVGQRPRITDAMGNPQGSQMFGVAPPPLPLYDTPGSASGIEIKGDPNFIADQDITHTFGFGNIKQLPERGMMDILTSYMNDYSTPEERLQTARGRIMSRDVKSKAENDALMYIALNQGDINQDRLDFLKYRQSLRPEYGTNSATTMEVRPGEISFDEFMKQGKPNSYTGGAEIANFEAVNDPNLMGVGPGALMVPDAIAGISDQPGAGEMQTKPVASTGTPPVGIPDPDMTQRPMPFSGLASLTKLPMFQEFATKLEAEHPEASQLFSQMFMGSSQRPMPYQNPFMGMGMGSFYPMMGGMGMGMGGYNPMMGMGGGFNPMMGGMGMGGYSPFMGMNPMMGMGGGFNPMMGMSGGGLGSFYPQPSTYGPPQSMPSMGGYPTPPQSSPFGGAMRGYYA